MLQSPAAHAGPDGDPGCTADAAPDILAPARTPGGEGVESPFVGDSGTARRMRDVEWAGTPLGAPHPWGEPPSGSSQADDLDAGRILAEAERRFRAMADSTPALIWADGPGGRRLFVNRGWLEFTGAEPATDLGLAWRERIHPADRAHYDRVRAAAAGGPFEVEYRLRAATATTGGCSTAGPRPTGTWAATSGVAWTSTAASASASGSGCSRSWGRRWTGRRRSRDGGRRSCAPSSTRDWPTWRASSRSATGSRRTAAPSRRTARAGGGAAPARRRLDGGR